MKALTLFSITLMLCISAANAASTGPQSKTDKMSAMGQRAAAAVAKLKQQTTGRGGPEARTQGADAGDDCLNQPRCPQQGDREERAPGGQAELSIAVDEGGQHIVIGFNDTRGLRQESDFGVGLHVFRGRRQDLRRRGSTAFPG